MNGVHDMGGLQCMGAVHPETNEPVFHEAWQGRVYAMDKSLRARGKWNLDAWRYEIELLPPLDYLRMSYYERWLAVNERLLVKHRLVTEEELASGTPASGSAKLTPVLTVAMAKAVGPRIAKPSDDPAVRPLFQVGEAVRARKINPVGHTRLPRYARGRTGKVVTDHGVFLFPDTNSQFLGEKRQHVYSVRFAARELWGDEASPRDCVYLDLWDDYLEPA